MIAWFIIDCLEFYHEQKMWLCDMSLWCNILVDSNKRILSTDPPPHTHTDCIVNVFQRYINKSYIVNKQHVFEQKCKDIYTQGSSLCVNHTNVKFEQRGKWGNKKLICHCKLILICILCVPTCRIQGKNSSGRRVTWFKIEKDQNFDIKRAV